MICTIKKGAHYSSGFSLGSTHCNIREMYFDTIFSASCLTLPGNPDCDGDFNKLFGWSYGLHQKNSIRIAWKAKGGLIRIAAYLYEFGKRRTYGYAWCETDRMYAIGARHSFNMDAGGNITNNRISFICDEKYADLEWHGCNPSCGYTLKPYYGGDCTAPAEMTIVLL